MRLYNKESVEHFVYLGEALECLCQINNTPHLYDISADRHDIPSEVMMHCFFLDTLKFSRFLPRIKAKTLSSKYVCQWSGPLTSTKIKKYILIFQNWRESFMQIKRQKVAQSSKNDGEYADKWLKISVIPLVFWEMCK